MRIACIHIPQFALQCATRLDPSLRGAPVAVVSGVEPGRERAGVLHAPIVLACSRAAWALGVRLGMTATAARGLSPQLALVTAESAQEREAIRALGDSLLALTATVDLGGRVGAGGAHQAMYVEVPAKTRGTAFGDRIVTLLDELGFAARVGIADDRFTAWVAAAHEHTEDRPVVSVPRGGAAAFLAPRPLSLLAITPEVQHMLEALGVRTLGEFASLPAPSIARPFEADYQALARGESGSQLRGYAPEAPIREDVVVTAGNVLELEGALSAPAAIALVARRIALRLAGRGRAAAHLEIVARAHQAFGAYVARPAAVVGYGAVATVDTMPEPVELPISLSRPVGDAEDVAASLTPLLEATSDTLASNGAWRLRVVVTEEAVVDADGVVHIETPLGADASQPIAMGSGATRTADAGTARPVGPSASVRGGLSGVAANSNSIFARDASELPSSDELRPARAHRPSGRASSYAQTTLRSVLRANAADAVHASDTRAANDVDSETDAGDHADTLSVVLASTGSLFALSAQDPRTDRREAHRRLRRGKQRRTRPTVPVQVRLFERASSK